MKFKSTYQFSLLFLPIIILLYCCNKGKKTEALPEKDNSGKFYFDQKEEFVKWSETNVDFIINKKLGDFNFTLKLVSADQMAIQELRGNVSDKKKFDEAKSHYTDLLYFKLNIQNEKYQQELLRYNLKSKEEYKERINYCSFHIPRDLQITNETDTLPCALHQFERTFNIQSGLNFVIAFAKIDFKKGITVIYQDLLFKNGLMKFYFKKDINELPYFKIP